MKKSIPLFLTLLLDLSPVYADFNSGVVAYMSGDYETAYNTMMSLADTSNDPMAQYWIGTMYLKGQGVEKNYEEAGKWFRRSAEQSMPQAQYKLGRLYSNGNGVPQDNEFAYIWYSVAASHQHKKSTLAVEKIKSQLSTEELKNADKLVPEYVEKFGPKKKLDPNRPVKFN